MTFQRRRRGDRTQREAGPFGVTPPSYPRRHGERRDACEPSGPTSVSVNASCARGPDNPHVSPIGGGLGRLPTMPPIGFSCALKGSCCQQRGPAASTATTTDTLVPKTQTTSTTTPRFSAFFTEVVCTLGTTQPQTATSPPPNGGNGVIRTTTRRRHADSQPLVLQNPHRHRYGGHWRDRRARPRHWRDRRARPRRRRDRKAGLRGTRAAVPVGGGAGQRSNAPIEARGADGRSGRHRHHRQPNLACNSPAARIDTSSKTAEYQRSEPKLRHAFTGIACEIGG